LILPVEKIRDKDRFGRRKMVDWGAMSSDFSAETRKVEPRKRSGFSPHRLVNLLLWWSFCALAGTGFLLAFRLPPGSQGGQGLAALGLSRHEWGEIHTWIGYVVVAAILLHLLLHWRWLWQFAARRRAWPLWLGLGAGIVLFATLALLPVEKRAGKREGGGHNRGAEARSSAKEH
jgi:hypothetical protein